MKKFFSSAILILIGLSSPAFSETLLLHVNGMVCSFCAQGIEKKFKAESSVDHVKVDLENKIVTVHTKLGQTLNDDRIGKIIKDAGYSLNSIERPEKIQNNQQPSKQKGI